jgi:hypothetical protein
MMTNFIEKLKNFFSDLKEVALIILSIATAIFASLFFIEKKKDEVQKDLTKNAETIQKVDAINNQINTVENATKEKENEPVTKDDLLNFLDNTNKPK